MYKTLYTNWAIQAPGQIYPIGRGLLTPALNFDASGKWILIWELLLKTSAQRGAQKPYDWHDYLDKLLFGTN